MTLVSLICISHYLVRLPIRVLLRVRKHIGRESLILNDLFYLVHGRDVLGGAGELLVDKLERGHLEREF